jgi:hypothetical protein
VLGEKREFLFAALDRFAHNRVQELGDAGPFPDSLTWKMRTMFPEKCSCLKEDILRTVIHLAARRAEQYAISTESGITLLTILMLFLGHEVDKDPTAPWVEEALRDSMGSELSQRIEKLYAATCGNIRLLLANRGTHHGLG